jgi:uncharacterized membrane protein
MSSQRIVGIVLLVLGLVALIYGLNASNSAADQVSHTFTGKFTGETMWYILCGLAGALVGLLMTIFGVSDRSA